MDAKLLDEAHTVREVLTGRFFTRRAAPSAPGSFGEERVLRPLHPGVAGFLPLAKALFRLPPANEGQFEPLSVAVHVDATDAALPLELLLDAHEPVRGIFVVRRRSAAAEEVLVERGRLDAATERFRDPPKVSVEVLDPNGRIEHRAYSRYCFG